MAWLSDFPVSIRLSPLGIRSALARALHMKRPSTLYAITSAQTADNLLNTILERNEDICANYVALAHARIVASSFLVRHVMRSMQRLEKLAWHCRSESLANIQRSVGIWQRVLVGSNANLAAAEDNEKQLRSIDHLIEVMQQFTGVHMEVVDDIQIALSSQRPDEVGRAIVASCRQASAFYQAISGSTHTDQLVGNIDNVVRSSLNASTKRDYLDQKDASGQLEQFWNQSGSWSSKQGLSAHDIRLTLQVLERELQGIDSVMDKLRSLIEGDLGRPWDIQRRPLQYTGLTVLSLGSAKFVSENSSHLGGSGLIEERMTMCRDAMYVFASNNVIEPVVRLYQQIFRVSDMSASAESVAGNREALREMLVEFTQTHLSHVEGAEEMAKNGSMTAVMNVIMKQAKHPFRNSIAGSLGQAFILQIQKLKCDVEELMLKSKQMLRAQELNLALIALVPSLLTAATLTYFFSTFSLHWKSRNLHLIMSGSQSVRFVFSDIQETLLALESNEAMDMHDMRSIRSHMKLTGSIHLKVCELEEIVNKGLIQAHESVLHRFTRDLKLLRSTSTTISSRRRQINRILQTYDFLQHK